MSLKSTILLVLTILVLINSISCAFNIESVSLDSQAPNNGTVPSNSTDSASSGSHHSSNGTDSNSLVPSSSDSHHPSNSTDSNSLAPSSSDSHHPSNSTDSSASWSSSSASNSSSSSSSNGTDSSASWSSSSSASNSSSSSNGTDSSSWDWSSSSSASNSSSSSNGTDSSSWDWSSSSSASNSSSNGTDSSSWDWGSSSDSWNDTSSGSWNDTSSGSWNDTSSGSWNDTSSGSWNDTSSGSWNDTSSSYSSSSNSDDGWDCVIYISVNAINQNDTCGTKADPCPGLYDAIEACNYQDATDSMMFIFSAGNYVIPNDNPIKYLSLYNQKVFIQGDSSNGGTIFSFLNSSEPALIINESAAHNPSTFDNTQFTIVNITITDISNTFITSITDISSVTINIQSCVFSNLQITSNLIYVVGTDLNNVALTVSSTLFSKVVYNGPTTSIVEGFVVYTGNSTNSFTTCTFNQNSGAGSAVHFSQGKGFIQESSFTSNSANFLVFSKLQYSSTILLTNNTFTSNTKNTGANSFLVGSLSSTVQIQYSTISQNSISAFFVADFNQTTTKMNGNIFTSNTVSKNNAANLVYADQGSNINSYENTITSNTFTVSTFYANQSKSFIVSQNSYNQNSGIFINAAQSNDVEVIDNTFSNNQKFQFLDCANSNITTTLNNNSTINQLSGDDVVVCGSKCNINKDGCPTKEVTASSSDVSHPKKDNKGKIIAIVLTISFVAIAGAAAAYYFIVYKKKHHYTRINSDF